MELINIAKNVKQGARLNAELGTHLVLKLDGVETPMESSLVGMEPGSHVIIKTPVMPGIRKKLKFGSVVTVRYTSEGNEYGFESRILDTVVKPPLLTFLSYPENGGGIST